MKQNDRIIKLIGAAMIMTAGTACSAAQKPSVSIKSGDHYLEYGIDLWDTEDDIHPDIMKYISKYNGELSLDDSELDTLMLGEQSLYITAETEEDEVTEEMKVIIQDTSAPVIELASDTVYAGMDEEIDLLDNIVNVYDQAEGELEYLEFSEEDGGIWVLDEPYEDLGFWVIDYFSMDPSQPGTYPVRIIACDNHGNVTKAEFSLVLGDDGAHEDKPVTVQGKAEAGNVPAEEAIQKVLEEYCTEIGADWDEGCTFVSEYEPEDDPEYYDDGDEEYIDDAWEEGEEDVWIEDDSEWSEEDTGDEDWSEEEWTEEDDEEWSDEDEYYEEDTESDPEQDCYDMGGEWVPEAGGCAWFDDDEE